MSIETIRDNLGDYARDIKLNLGTVLTLEGAPELTETQIAAIALSAAYSTKNATLVAAIKTDFVSALSETLITSAQAAATIMAMNNVYYRFTHYVSDETITKLPAKLRMNVIGNPGIEKNDFELMCLAVSAINGCGKCMEAHAHELSKSGISALAIQSSVRIASVIHAAAQALAIQSI